MCIRDRSTQSTWGYFLGMQVASRKTIDDCEMLLIKGRQKVPIPKVLECYGILEKLLNNILNNPKDESKKLLKKTNKIIAEKVLAIPLIEDFFKTLGYEQVDAERLQYKKEDLASLKAVLGIIHNYKDKYDQVPEEALKQAQEANEEEKKRKAEFEKVEKQAGLDRLDKSKDEKVGDSVAKDIKFGATEVVFKPPTPAPGRK
eukprot:TRINITY_DN6103_c0_g1_i1.p1 TRINITY_DN6103_c0_g1~~TRINITY_DN6103_c0_g1_i1.p1  ORF type:complete len:202 (+),score=78.12 TRINITY_DN6103_c0_g1_i1:67-672(+)